MSGENGAREALHRLIDAHVADVLSAPAEEILAEVREAGVDLDAEKARMLELFRVVEGRVGRARMGAARAALTARKAAPVLITRRAPPGEQEPALTLAARNGNSQSERDKLTLQADLDELASFEPDKEPE